MDALYGLNRATVAQIQERLPEAPSYSTVRALLRILETKGHVRHEQDGPRYVYVPVIARDRARRFALQHVMRTFFHGSAEQTVAALLEMSDTRLSDIEYERLVQLIEQARQKEDQP